MPDSRRFVRLFSTLIILISLAFPTTARTDGERAHPETEKILDAVDWREIGPYRGGRSAAVAGVLGDRDTY